MRPREERVVRFCARFPVSASTAPGRIKESALQCEERAAAISYFVFNSTNNFTDFVGVNKENPMQFRIFTSLALVLLYAVAARAQVVTNINSASADPAYAAYSVYYYNTSGTGYGMAGRIADSGGDSSSAIIPYPNLAGGTTSIPLNGDPTAIGFGFGSTQGIAVTDYTGSAGNPVYIFNATNGDLATDVSGGWSDVANFYDIATIGNYLYALDYDNGRVVEINPKNDYAQTGVSYTVSPVVQSGVTYYPHGVAVLNISGTLYGLFAFANSTFTTYIHSELFKFTIVGGSSITVAANNVNNNFARNAFAMSVSSSKLYVASIGGYQGAGYNTTSSIQSIAYGGALRGATVSSEMSPSSTRPYNFLDISFNGGTAYVLMGAYDENYNLSGVLLKTTNFSTFTTIDSFTSIPYYYWAAQYTSDNNRLWYVRGNQIWVYDAAKSGAPVAKLILSAGSLLSNSDPYPYNNLSNFSIVDPSNRKAVRGYRSPIQVSHTEWAERARALAQGRPGLTKEELDQLNREFDTK
jgi:hypothetical protein